MSWGYLEDASGVQGHAERICIPQDEAELLALLAEAYTARAPSKLLQLQYRAEEIAAMQAVKRRFDPDGRLGPGTLFSIPPG